MNRRFECGALVLLTGACATLTLAQNAPSSRSRTADTEVIRVIRDLHNGMTWVLERDSQNPAGPGRMIPLERPEASRNFSTPETNEPLSVKANQPMKVNTEARPLVIRSGDRLVVEEDSAVVEVRLEAYALGSAIEGAALPVRLAIGGKVVRAVARAPGRATFAAGLGTRR